MATYYGDTRSKKVLDFMSDMLPVIMAITVIVVFFWAIIDIEKNTEHMAVKNHFDSTPKIDSLLQQGWNISKMEGDIIIMSKIKN